jgi:hypothetical protein
MASPIKYGDTVACTSDDDDILRTFADAKEPEGGWDDWAAEPQDGNECLTFKRMLPKLGPKPAYKGAWK